MTRKWPVVPLGELIETLGGLWTGKKEPFVKATVIRSTNFGKGQRLDLQDVAVLDVEASQFGKRELEHGDLVLEKSGGGPNQPVGRVVVFDRNETGYSYSNFTNRLRILDRERVLPEYLHQFLTHFHLRGGTESIQSNSTSIRNLSMPDYLKVEVPLPPLDDQKRIVAKLDEAMDSIVEAERIIGEAVIQLVEFENASREHFLSTTKSNMHVSELSELAEIRYGFTDSASHEKRGPKFLRITDIQDRKVNWSLVPRCEISTDDHEKQRLRSGDLVFARTGATTGKSFLITEDVPDAVAASYLIRVRPNQTRINPRYLSVYFNSREYWESVEDGSTGSAQGGFNASKLGALTIRFPESLQHQSEIVQYSHNLDEQSSGLRVSLLSKATAINSLKGTLLTAAFAGEL